MDRREYVEALRAERAQYAAGGLDARVAEVDAELARYDEQPAGGPVETTEGTGARASARKRG